MVAVNGCVGGSADDSNVAPSNGMPCSEERYGHTGILNGVSGSAGRVSPMTDKTVTPQEIHRLIPFIIAALPAIGKDRQMSAPGQGTYAYRGIEDILPHINSVFAQFEVHCTPTYRILSDDTYQVKSGATWRRVVVEGTFRFYAPDGSYVDTVTLGEANDGGDKACAKAQTAAYKAALVQTFVLSEVHAEDPDHSHSEESEAAGEPPEPPAGTITKVEAKTRFMVACDGDADCAKQQWDAANLAVIDDHYVNADAVTAALTNAVTQALTTAEDTPLQAGDSNE